MKNSIFVMVIFLLFPAVVFAGAGGGGDDPIAVDPDGMFVMTPVLDRSCIAVKVSLAADQALSGVRWYNNDDQTVFPQVLVASGYTNYPPLYADGVVVSSNVAGEEVTWSEVQFSEPMASETGTLYVIFQLPSNQEGEQMGVGPAIGYVTTEEPSCVFVSPDGDDWSRMITDYQLLVDPVYTFKEPGMVTLSCSNPHPEELLEWITEAEVPVVFEDELLRPYPNPFNPTTTLAFTLKTGDRVELAVFDIRGRRVAEIHTGYLESGRHEFQWQGKDYQDGRVASGVYFARLKISNELQVQRMMLLK